MSIETADRRHRARARSSWFAAILQIGLAALVLFLVAYPFAMLVAGSFLGRRPSAAASGDPFAAYRRLAGDLEPLWNTIAVGAASTAMAVAIGVTLAWVLVRTDVPFRRTLAQVAVVPFYLTPMLGAVGWSILGSPGETGLINKALLSLVGWAPLDVYSPAGIVWVMGLYFAPFCYLFTAAALSSMDPSLEESAQLLGSSMLRTAREVSLPLVLPAILGSSLLIFVQAIGQFGVPAVLGMPHGFLVATTRIYEYTAGFSPNYAAASALGLALFAISALGVFLQGRLLGGRSFTTVTGRGFRPRAINTRGYRYLFLGIVLAYLLAAVVLPLGSILWAALLKFMVSDVSAAQYTLDNFHYVLVESPATRIAIWNSIILGVGGATLTLVLGAATAWVVKRGRLPGRGLLEYLTLAPLAIPGMIFSLGLLWAWIRFPLLPVYGTLWLLLICYVTLYLPYAFRSTSATLLQLDRSLEECAATCGATPGYVARTITLPLLSAGLWAAWTLLFISTVKELSASALLSNSKTIVLSVAVFELWNGSSFAKVAALAVTESVLIFSVLLVARRLGRAGSMMP